MVQLVGKSWVHDMPRLKAKYRAHAAFDRRSWPSTAAVMRASISKLDIGRRCTHQFRCHARIAPKAVQKAWMMKYTITRCFDNRHPWKLLTLGFPLY